jgi:hypothetical protein
MATRGGRRNSGRIRSAGDAELTVIEEEEGEQPRDPLGSVGVRRRPDLVLR